MERTEITAPGHVRVLVVDDDRQIQRSFRLCLEEAGYQVATAGDAGSAEQKMAESVFDLCFLDLRLGEISGMDLLPRLRQQAPWMRVIMVTGESSVELAVAAIKSGAADFLVKPCPAAILLGTAARQAQARSLEKRVQMLEDGVANRAEGIDPVSGSPVMRRLIETARQVADTDASVLILGENGTGKGVIARAIHHWSQRAQEELVTINCPGLSQELIASELFGHIRGAFTGAHENKLGRVDQADRGTLFFDEIGDIPVALQPKLLRFIQDREYERVGDPVTRRADVRIIAATNRDLQEMVAAGTFREDLLYRLNVITLSLPPLRERAEDIPDLAQRFLFKFAQEYRRQAREFSPEAGEYLRNYRWPGNIRELQNVIERAVILAQGETVSLADLGVAAVSAAGNGVPRAGDPIAMEVLERAHIEAVLARASSLDAAARTLGIDASTLYRKRKRYCLP